MNSKDKSKMARFTLRIPKELLDKFGYVAEYEARTKNKELEQMIKERIISFEQQHGEIELREESEKSET